MMYVCEYVTDIFVFILTDCLLLLARSPDHLLASGISIYTIDR